MRIDGSVQISEARVYYESEAAEAAGREGLTRLLSVFPLKCHRVDFIPLEIKENATTKLYVKNTP